MGQIAAVQAQEFYRLAQLFVRTDAFPVEQVRLVRRALKQAHAAEAPEKPRLSVPEAVRIIAVASGKLLDRREHFTAALLLTRNTPDRLADQTDVAVMRCRALIQLRQRAAAVAEADRLLALKPADDRRDRAVVDLMKSVLLHHDIQASFRLHDLVWGARGATGIETLQKLDASAYFSRFDSALLTDLLTIRNQPAGDMAPLCQDLAWGLAASYYQKFLADAGTDLRRRRLVDPSAVAEGVTQAFLESCTRLTDAPPDPALQALVAQGRSVVLLQSHSGARGVISQSLAELDCPLSLVGKGTRVVRPRTSDFHITTGTASDLPLQFLKLAKLVRKGQRVIRLLPDGSDGREFGEIDLLSRKLAIGLGGASLAMHGKAVLAFAKTRWTGEGWVVDVVIGPDLAQVADRAAAEKLFLDFYAENLRNILLGPPKDIGGAGGFLASLRK